VVLAGRRYRLVAAAVACGRQMRAVPHCQHTWVAEHRLVCKAAAAVQPLATRTIADCVVLLCTGVEEAGSDEMMSLVQEAHIVSMDIGDDRLGDDEWNLLSNTASLVQIHIQIFWPDHLV